MCLDQRWYERKLSEVSNRKRQIQWRNFCFFFQNNIHDSSVKTKGISLSLNQLLLDHLRTMVIYQNLHFSAFSSKFLSTKDSLLRINSLMVNDSRWNSWGNQSKCKERKSLTFFKTISLLWWVSWPEEGCQQVIWSKDCNSAKEDCTEQITRRRSNRASNLGVSQEFSIIFFPWLSLVSLKKDKFEKKACSEYNRSKFQSQLSALSQNSFQRIKCSSFISFITLRKASMLYYFLFLSFFFSFQFLIFFLQSTLFQQFLLSRWLSFHFI